MTHTTLPQGGIHFPACLFRLIESAQVNVQSSRPWLKAWLFCHLLRHLALSVRRTHTRHFLLLSWSPVKKQMKYTYVLLLCGYCGGPMYLVPGAILIKCTNTTKSVISHMETGHLWSVCQQNWALVRFSFKIDSTVLPFCLFIIGKRQKRSLRFLLWSINLIH